MAMKTTAQEEFPMRIPLSDGTTFDVSLETETTVTAKILSGGLTEAQVAEATEIAEAHVAAKIEGKGKVVAHG